MANFNNIKHEIDQNVNTNGVQAITGAILNETLKDMIDEVDEKKQDTLVAGQNITIQGNVISATGGGSGETYTAGHGIDISSNNEISVDPSDLAGNGLLSDGEGHLTLDYDSLPQYVEGFGISITTGPYAIAVDASDLAGSGLEVDEFGALKTDPSVVQGKLTPGANIQISGNTISATDTTYSAGDGLEIDQNNEISVKAGSGLGFDSNGYLINTGGGGGGTTYTAGDGIEIDSNDSINAKLGNGLQLDGSNNIEVDAASLAGSGIYEDQGTLNADYAAFRSYFLPLDGGQLQDPNGDTELTVMDGNSEDYVKLGAYETPGEKPHVEIFENGSGDTKIFYDHLERGSQVSIDLPASSGTIALTSDIPDPGAGLQVSASNEIYVDTTQIQEKLVAGQNITITGNVISATGGGQSYSAGQGIDINNNVISVDASDLAGNGMIANSSGYLEPDFSVVASQSDLLGKQDTLVAGANITINGNTISATDTNTTYSAGSGLSLNGTTFSVDTNAIQEKLTAGTGISINGTTISATGGGGSGLWVNGTGTNSLMAPATAASANTDASGEGALNAGIDDDHVPGAIRGSYAGGDYSASFGFANQALGDYSAAFGSSNTASGMSSFAIGGGNSAVGDGSFAGGNLSTANGRNNLAFNGTTASGVNNIAINGRVYAGDNNVALGGNVSLPGGQYNVSSAVALGGGTAVADNSLALGGETNGENSTALGKHSHTSNENEIGMGYYNKTYTSGNNDTSVDTMFTLGNGEYNAGTGTATQKNAIEVKKNNDLYISGVGGFTGANSGSSDTLQTVLAGKQDTLTAGSGISIQNNVISATGGGGGTSFTPGDALELDQNDNLNVLYGPGLTVNGNNELEVDPSSISGFLPLDGGTLQDTTGSNATALNIESPNSDITFMILADEGAAAAELNIENNTVLEPNPGEGESYTQMAITQNGHTTLYLGSNAHFVDDNGTLVEDGFGGYTEYYVDGGQQTSARINISVSSSNLSDPGNETTEAFIELEDQNGYKKITTEGFNDGTYTLSFPGLVNDDIIATSSELSNALSGYLPLTGGTLQANPSDAETLLDVAAPDSTSSISMSADYLVSEIELSSDISDSSIQDGDIYKVALKNTGEISVLSKTVNPLDPTDITPTAYTLVLPQKNDTIATLSDIQGGGSSYSAGAGINIDANNVISNTAPDPGLWVAGTGAGSIRTFTSSSGSAGGLNSIAIGDNTVADGGYSTAIGSSSRVYGSNLYATAIAGGQVGTFGSYGYQHAVAIGNGSYCTAADTIALGVGTRSFNQGEASIGYYANAITGGTTAENTRFTVGNGTGNGARSNLIEAKQNNDLYIYGVGGFTGTNASSASTLQAVLSGKQDTLTAGSGITITNNVISATGGGGGGSLWTNGTGTDSLVAPATITAGLAVDPAQGTGAISCGYDTNADGDYAFAQGGQSSASGNYSFAANNSTAAGNYSAAFGAAGANGTNSFAAVSGSADADYSVALAGGQVVYDDTDPNDIKNAQYGVAIGDGSVVEGEYGLAFMGGLASGSHSVAIGDAASASEMYSTAFAGSGASGNYSFAASTGQAGGHYSSAFGGGNAVGEGSLASGFSTSAHGYCSAALGYALSTYSQADGALNTDPNAGEVALGRYNYSESGIVFTVGCGYLDETDPDNPTEVRQNAVAIDSTGKIYLKGLGGYTGQSVSGCTDLASFLSNL